VQYGKKQRGSGNNRQVGGVGAKSGRTLSKGKNKDSRPSVKTHNPTQRSYKTLVDAKIVKEWRRKRGSGVQGTQTADKTGEDHKRPKNKNKSRR